MIDIVDISREPNQGAIEILEDAIQGIKDGEILAVSLSYVTSTGALDGQWSEGDNRVLLWAAIEHSAKSFYMENIL